MAKFQFEPQNKIITILALPQGSGFPLQSFFRKKPQKRIFTAILNAKGETLYNLVKQLSKTLFATPSFYQDK
jgi:hypothetical protein